ncbi:MAG: hypothetical protein KKF54_04020 [Candidatus Omnitrophica bacterium]|nr:hypothetical protein [Candidatus Omnitrophota bacterium]
MANFVTLATKQSVLPYLRNLLACFSLSFLQAPLKQTKIVYNTMILAFKQGVKVILTLPTVLHRVIEKTSHLIRKNSFYCTKTAPDCSIKASGTRLMSSNRCLAQGRSDVELRLSQMYVFINYLRILKYIFQKNIQRKFFIS